VTSDFAAAVERANEAMIRTFGEPVVLRPNDDPAREVTVPAIYQAPVSMDRGGALSAPLADSDYRIVIETDQLPVLVPGDRVVVRNREFALVTATDDTYGCTTLILRPV
jgi:hypothetical protein